MACPFFMPTARSMEGAWIHPDRLPLGSGWEGHCTAPGHEGAMPEPERLHQDCSLGYASNCPRLPDSGPPMQFGFPCRRENEARVLVTFVCERNHLPVEHGNLEFRVQDGDVREFSSRLADPEDGGVFPGIMA